MKSPFHFCGVEENIENLHLTDEVYDYSFPKRMGMYVFFAKHLSLFLEKIMKEDGAVDESSIIIEAKEEILVFDEKHPRSAYAVKLIHWK